MGHGILHYCGQRIYQKAFLNILTFLSQYLISELARPLWFPVDILHRSRKFDFEP